MWKVTAFDIFAINETKLDANILDGGVFFSLLMN